MPRPRKGSIVRREVEVKGKNGKLKKKVEIYARVTYMEGGKRKDIWRRAENNTQANEIIKELLRDLDDKGAGYMESSKMTFGDLARYFEDKYLVEPVYVDGRKISGRRSYKVQKIFLRYLKEYFNDFRLRAITYGEIEKYKLQRLSTKTTTGKQRTITSVNRELQVLRRMLNIALRENWIARNPFNAGDTLINIADEKKRKRVLSLEEEERLLAVCNDRIREHLKPIIIAALDTGFRRGELLKLEWQDIDFEKRIITVRAFNTKTLTERKVAMTTRLEQELRKISKERTWLANYIKKGGVPDKEMEKYHRLVFGVSDIKHSFHTACTKAEIKDFHFHDLRRTFNTRLAPYLPQTEIMRLMGHTQVQTNYRYVGAADEMLYRAASALVVVP